MQTKVLAQVTRHKAEVQSVYVFRAQTLTPLLIFALCLVPCALTFSGCGKRRPPQPPVGGHLVGF